MSASTLRAICCSSLGKSGLTVGSDNGINIGTPTEIHAHIPVLWSSEGGEGVSTAARSGPRNLALRSCDLDKDGKWTVKLDTHVRCLFLKPLYKPIEQGLPSFQSLGKIPINRSLCCNGMQRRNESGQEGLKLLHKQCLYGT